MPIETIFQGIADQLFAKSVNDDSFTNTFDFTKNGKEAFDAFYTALMYAAKHIQCSDKDFANSLL